MNKHSLESRLPKFRPGQTLVLLPSLKSALHTRTGLAKQLARAQRYHMPPEALHTHLNYALSLAGVKLASINADHSISTLAARNLCCADLAQLRVEVNGIRALAIGNIALSDAQDAHISAVLERHFDELGMRLHRLGTAQYVLELPVDAPGPVAPAPSELIGSAISSQLPEPARWRLLLNESQMLLAQSPIGKANSLWFYGAEIPEPSGKTALAVHLAAPTSDPLLLGLQALNPVNAASHALNIFDWRAPISANNMLAKHPLWLSFDSGELYYLTRFDALKFWRKKQSFDIPAPRHSN